jgi:hypothetical protein
VQLERAIVENLLAANYKVVLHGEQGKRED